MFSGYFHGRRVLVTGHTGFKGSWLSVWLERLGAQVTGLSVDVPTQPSLFDLACVQTRVDHLVGDVRDTAAVNAALDSSDPEVVFHLAAQPLVRLSYEEPVDTLSVNVIGTAQLLDAIRRRGKSCNVIVVTSDKCYENNGQIWGYREVDPLGGHDPYSMSKSAAELVVDSWRNSYFSSPDSGVLLASARAGNVVGGGDWGRDRLIPDCITALTKDIPILIRNPLSTRPWQHVLEPLSGYLWLATMLATGHEPKAYAQSWNFGPSIEGVRPVRDVVDLILQRWGKGRWELDCDIVKVHEAFALALNCEKARHCLQWSPAWTFETAISETVAWYRNWASGTEDIHKHTISQIEAYEMAAQRSSLTWAKST